MKGELQEALLQLEKEKGIKREILINAMKDALTYAYKKDFGSLQNIRAEFDNKKGFYLVATKKVVEEVKNPNTQISLSEAQAINPKVGIGDNIEIEFLPEGFGRIAAQTAKQVVTQRLREAEKNLIYEEYKEKKGEIVTGIVQRTGKKQSVLVQLGKIEGILPVKEQMAKEKYKVGDRIKCYLLDVKMSNKGPQVILSRTYPGLVKRLFEMEVPEIYENIVKIVSVSRDPGYRTKIAVESESSNVDAVGSCVGMKGMRVQAIIKELKGEKIDIVGFSPDPQIFIKNALSPAKVDEVIINDEKKRHCLAIVPDNQLSLAIGRKGQNVRLASKLTNWRIDIKTQSQIAKERESELRKKAEEELFKKIEKKETTTAEIKDLAGGELKLEEKLKNAESTTIKDIASSTTEKLAVAPQT